jgi:hypothetical protein
MDSPGPRRTQWAEFGLEETWNLDEQDRFKTHQTQKKKEKKKKSTWFLRG